MSSRKADTEGIDEALLLDSIGRRKQDGSVQPQEPKDASMPKAAETQSVSTAESTKEGGRRKRQNVDYTTTFLKRNEIKTRQCVYISREIHNQISRAEQSIPVNLWVKVRIIFFFSWIFPFCRPPETRKRY